MNNHKLKSLKLALVIPAFNEEHHIKACLESIATQTVKPNEVILVDNNCTDRTVAVARKFSFVTVIKEKKQHQVFAQAVGFDKASSDILARIDADSVLPPDWVEQITKAFLQDKALLAFSGTGEPYDVPLKKLGTWIFQTYHEVLSARLAGHPMLWGSNMAFRASAWPKLKKVMHFRSDLWEDYDMSFHLAKMGKIEYSKELKVSCSYRAAHKSLIHQLRYQLRAVRTFRLHRSFFATVGFALVWSTLVFLYPFAFVDRYLWKWQQFKKRQ